MQKFNKNEFIWAEKYRPQIVSDLIIDEYTKSMLNEWVESKEIPNLGLFGLTPGTGKTSLAKSLINDINADYTYINASKENGIDLIRNKLLRFASSVSISGGIKVVLLDEADGLTSTSQESLRAFIEEFSQNCRFIITANYKSRIIEPLLNRLNNIDFDNILTNNKKYLANLMLQRVIFILNNENVKYDNETLKNIIKKLYPSLRSIIIELQKNTVNGELKININDINIKTRYDKLISALKTRKYENCRNEISICFDLQGFYMYLFQNIDDIFSNEGPSIANAIMIIHEYLLASNTIRDYTINLSAFCAKILSHQNIKFKGEC